MKATVSPLVFGRYQFPQSVDGLLSAASALEHLGLAGQDWQAVVVEHSLPLIYRDFGRGPEPALSLPCFCKLAFALQTAEARRWQKKAQELLARTLAGDIGLAAQIAERAPSPEARRWLAARLESIGARRELLSTVARHGGNGQVYGQLGSISNRAVLGKNSALIRQERGVKATRDGLTSEELLRLAYIDTVSAHAIAERGTQGNTAILRLHEQVAASERERWEKFGPKAS